MASWKLTTWNVNSVRARLDHVLAFLEEREPDVLLLQETKVEDHLFPRIPFMELGYTVTVHGAKAYAGVATLSKSEPSEVEAGFRKGRHDPQCRILSTLVDGVRIYNLYVPNGQQVGCDAYKYKLAWLRRLAKQLQTEHNRTEPIILAGDFNIAPSDADLPDPEGRRGQILFSKKEHAALNVLLSFGLRDCFRVLSDEAGVYSWYDYKDGVALEKGMRIDHVYATAPLVSRLCTVEHDQGPRKAETPSDHLPVTAEFDLSE